MAVTKTNVVGARVPSDVKVAQCAAANVERRSVASALKVTMLSHLHIDSDHMLPLTLNGPNLRQQSYREASVLELASRLQTDPDIAKPLLLMTHEDFEAPPMPARGIGS